MARTGCHRSVADGGRRPPSRLRVSLRGRTLATPAVLDGVVYGTTDHGMAYACVPLTRTFLWSVQAHALPDPETVPGRHGRSRVPYFAGPAVHDGLVHLLRGDGILHSVDAATGEVRAPGLALGCEGGGAPAVAEGFVAACGHVPEAGLSSDPLGPRRRLAVTSADPDLAHDLTAPLWHTDLADGGGPGGGPLLSPLLPVAGLRAQVREAPGQGQSPAVHDGKVVVATDAGVGAFALRTGTPLWWRELPCSGDTSVAVGADGVVHVLTLPGGVHALDVRDGRTVWSTGLGALATLEGSPVVHGGRVYAAGWWRGGDGGHRGGAVAALDAASGRPLWHLRTDTPVRVPPSVDEDRLALVTTGHRDIAPASFLVLDAADGTPLRQRHPHDRNTDSLPTAVGSRCGIALSDGVAYWVSPAGELVDYDARDLGYAMSYGDRPSRGPFLSRRTAAWDRRLAKVRERAAAGLAEGAPPDA
ncbi:outer membrane protein assembly factor BamB family protein [Streptomyces hydrogenans]|uniref:outer membrane protein assembly factor BamB family protein n=1 Tax=Streptomyces hydrogenans TaxID=1873719 RepID=UPI00341E93B8